MNEWYKESLTALLEERMCWVSNRWQDSLAHDTLMCARAWEESHTWTASRAAWQHTAWIQVKHVQCTRRFWWDTWISPARHQQLKLNWTKCSGTYFQDHNESFHIDFIHLMSSDGTFGWCKHQVHEDWRGEHVTKEDTSWMMDRFL